MPHGVSLLNVRTLANLYWHIIIYPNEIFCIHVHIFEYWVKDLFFRVSDFIQGIEYKKSGTIL